MDPLEAEKSSLAEDLLRHTVHLTQVTMTVPNVQWGAKVSAPLPFSVFCLYSPKMTFQT